MLILTVGCMIQKLDPDLLGSKWISGNTYPVKRTEMDDPEDLENSPKDFWSLMKLSTGFLLVMTQVSQLSLRNIQTNKP